jgi:hypothetical protein
VIPLLPPVIVDRVCAAAAPPSTEGGGSSIAMKAAGRHRRGWRCRTGLFTMC